MRRELEQTLDRVYAALNWWLEGLRIGLPSRARNALFAARTELVVRFAGNAVAISAADAAPVVVDLDATDAKATIASLVPGTEAPEVTVLLPSGVVLTRTLRLPDAVENELRHTLEHELDRLTPFSIDDIVFDYGIRARTDATLLVEVALLRRAVLSEVVDKLERLGLRPAAITTESSDGARLPLNLLPRRRLRLPSARVSFRPAFAFGAALLLVAALYLPLSRYDRVLAARTAAAEAARTEAVAARARLAEQEAALASGELLTQRRREYVPPITLLRELTSQVPEHTWLSRFTISRGEVHLQGESAAATDLLLLLESTELLRDVQFQAPVSRGDESGKEQFTIIAKLARSAP